MTSDSRIRVLYVTAGFPFPLRSGYLRHYHLIQRLAPQHRIHLLSLVGPSFRDGHVEGVAGFVDRVQTFRRVGGTVDRAVRSLDPTGAHGGTRPLVDAVAAAVEAGEVDVVVLSGKDTAAVAQVVAGRVPLVVDLCDAASARLSQELAFSSRTSRARLKLRRHELRRAEQHLVHRGNALLVASERDRAVLADTLKGGDRDRVRRAVVVPNGVDLDRWHRQSATLGDRVVFCGNLAYGPNADAARQLVHEVMPHVWARHPDAEVHIIGPGASRTLQEDLQRSLITLTGEVPDVRPHLETGAVFAAPLRIASGIQNKLLEALAMELPVVTSSVAAAGLVTGGAHPPLTVADDPATAGAAIARCLDDVGQGRTGVDAAGRAWVGERFSWQRSASQLATVIEQARNAELMPC